MRKMGEPKMSKGSMKMDEMMDKKKGMKEGSIADMKKDRAIAKKGKKK